MLSILSGNNVPFYFYVYQLLISPYALYAYQSVEKTSIRVYSKLLDIDRWLIGWFSFTDKLVSKIMRWDVF
jgi:hypothetical protein